MNPFSEKKMEIIVLCYGVAYSARIFLFLICFVNHG